MEEINVDADYFTHPKTLRLIGLLGKGAEIYPLKLWCWAARYHPESGLLADYSDEEVESVVGWTGEKGALVAGLAKVGFGEKNELGFYLHDFSARNGHIAAFKTRARAAAEARWGKLRQQNASSNATSIPKQSPTDLPTVLPTDEDKAATDATAQRMDSGRNFEQHLFHCWGKEGKVSKVVMDGFVSLAQRNGWGAVFRAVEESARYGKKSLAYVQGIVEPKEKANGTDLRAGNRQSGGRETITHDKLNELASAAERIVEGKRARNRGGG